MPITCYTAHWKGTLQKGAITLESSYTINSTGDLSGEDLVALIVLNERSKGVPIEDVEILNLSVTTKK